MRIRLARTAAVATAFAVTVPLAGCAVERGPGGLRAEAAPSALSDADYRARLTSSAAELTAAVKGIEGAKKYSDMAARLTAARVAADRTREALNTLSAPPPVQPRHSELVVALVQFARDMSVIEELANQQRLCTVAAVRQRVGASDGAVKLRRAVDRLGKAQGGYTFPATVAEAGKEKTRREKNGHLVKKGPRGGRGWLKVENQGDQDLVVSFTRKGEASIVVYVRGKGEVRIDSVANGTYGVFDTTGVDWDPGARAFSRDCSVRENIGELKFETIVSGRRIRWRNWTVKLGGDRGSLPSRPVSPDKFPAR